MPKATTYDSKMSQACLFVTFLALLLISFTAMFLSFRLYRNADGQSAYFIASLVFIAVMVGLCWGLAPTGYALSQDALLIRRPLGNIRISFTNMTRLETVEPGHKGWLRVFGNGGMFGFYGWFTHRSHGRVKMWVRNMDHLHLLHTSNGVYGLSTHQGSLWKELRAKIGNGAKA